MALAQVVGLQESPVRAVGQEHEVVAPAPQLGGLDPRREARLQDIVELGLEVRRV